MVKRIEVRNEGPAAEQLRLPHDRCHEKHDLNHRVDQLGDVPKPCGHHADEKRSGGPVQQDEQETWNGQQRHGTRPDSKIKQDTKVDYKIMGKNNQFAPTRSKNINRVGQSDLFDVGFCTSEKCATLGQKTGYEIPHQQTDAQIRQEIVDRGVEQFSVKHAERYDHDGHARG